MEDTMDLGESLEDPLVCFGTVGGLASIRVDFAAPEPLCYHYLW